MARLIESIMIPGPAGRLEALLEEPEFTPTVATLVCHPHPQHGGTMHNKVVYRLARGLRRERSVVLRFNYRGVNLSDGIYDKGVGEVDDARACLDVLRQRYPNLPYQLAGFSFGSRIALKLGCQTDAKRIIAVGFPTVYSDQSFLDECTRPRVFIQSTNDEFGPGPDLIALYETLPEPKEIHWVPASDHFFVDALDAFEAMVQQVARSAP
jgi:alpha/beta superfamily hydrolase